MTPERFIDILLDLRNRLQQAESVAVHTADAPHVRKTDAAFATGKAEGFAQAAEMVKEALSGAAK